MYVRVARNKSAKYEKLGKYRSYLVKAETNANYLNKIQILITWN